MSQRKTWTQKQDQILKMLREQRNMKKWSHVAQTMFIEFKIAKRNGKQCRQRYHNHLDSKIQKGQWTNIEKKNLLKLHNQLGNRWAQIARNLPGRTDNSVKNYFYSTFRRAIKNLNQIISKNFKKQFKPIKMGIMNKIIQKTQQCLNAQVSNKQQVLSTCIDLKNQILNYGDRENQQSQNIYQLIKNQQLIKEIYSFNKRYRKKKKSKKIKKKDQIQQIQQIQEQFQVFGYELKKEQQNSVKQIHQSKNISYQQKVKLIQQYNDIDNILTLTNIKIQNEDYIKKQQNYYIKREVEEDCIFKQAKYNQFIDLNEFLSLGNQQYM